MLAPGEREKEAIKDDVPGRPDWLAVLKAHELDVLKAVTRGLSNKEIGRELGLAAVIIKLHVCSIFWEKWARRAAPMRLSSQRRRMWAESQVFPLLGLVVRGSRFWG
jgi:FixJ family two-component response regulator